MGNLHDGGDDGNGLRFIGCSESSAESTVLLSGGWRSSGGGYSGGCNVALKTAI